VNRIADELQLAKHGMERGKECRPDKDAQTFDDVEHQIIERVEAHKQDGHSIYLDQLHTYDERLTAQRRTSRLSRERSGGGDLFNCEPWTAGTTAETKLERK
jgi:hypothetical protein